MKPDSKRFLMLFLIFGVLLGMLAFGISAVSADPAILYDGRTQQIVFERVVPFGGNAEPDLFPSLKNLMPGDSVSQSMTVGARNMAGGDTVRLSLRAENPNADYITLLETYGHWIDFTVKNGGTEITGDFADGVLLGTFLTEDTATLDVSLSIDINAGNEIAALAAEITWVFTAEVLPGVVVPPYEPDEPDIPADDWTLPWLTDVHINYIIGFQDNTVRPEDSITRAEVATVFYRLLTTEARESMWSTRQTYPDVTPEDWHYLAISTLTNGGILYGYPDGTFRPDAPLTRAELATVISRFDEQFGKIQVIDAFADDDGHWAEKNIEFSAACGYVIGYPDGTFRPDQSITRAETVTMVNRLLRRAVDETGITGDFVNWPDNEIGAWYYYEIMEAANYHTYTRSHRRIEGKNYTYENWTELLTPIDWERHEQQWVKVFERRVAAHTQ